MSSSSSSEDEDLQKFASCAVSADQIEKTVVEEAQKRALKASRRSVSTPGLAAKPATAATAASAGTGQGGDAVEAESTGLDLISVRVSLCTVVKMDRPPLRVSCSNSCSCHSLAVTYNTQQQ